MTPPDRFAGRTQSLELTNGIAVGKVLVGTAESHVSESLRNLLKQHEVKVLWARSVGEVKVALDDEDVAAFFCGFWLLDGTYRDVMSLLKQKRSSLPFVIVSGPNQPEGYMDNFASLNKRIFDFISHPYRREDFERILKSALGVRPEFLQHSTPLVPVPSLPVLAELQ
jgi:DNA-binding NtrC family response regulator